jgi:putative ABC transport system permease protein
VHQIFWDVFSIAWIGLALMIGIVLLGLLNSLFASVLERIRQIGVARAVGMTRRQVALWIVLESSFIGFITGMLAMIFGPLLDHFDTHVIGRVLYGYIPALPLQLTPLLFGLIAATLLAAGGGYFPARSAARLVITEALLTE